MNGKIYSISADQMEGLINDHCGLDAATTRTLVSAGAVSVPLLVGIYDGRPLCFVGFVPQTLLSDTAYMWLWAAPEVERNRTMFGRHAIGVVSRALKVYDRLIGHCTNDKSIRWLMTLGAEISPGTFEIRRKS